jgi:hypothetical protein
MKIIVIFLLIITALASESFASGHGPLFALSTPTNASGQWSIDFATLTIHDQENTGEVFRTVLSYGITQSFMLSVSAPFLAGQTESLTPALGSYEVMATWKFQRKDRGVGSRYESMVFGGVNYAADQFGVLKLVEKTPGIQFGGCTGWLSRKHYFWMGASYTIFPEKGGDKRPDLLFYSIAWGFRPDSWRKEYPGWDWRMFIEATGEKFGDLKINNLTLTDTDEHQLLIGPAILGQFKRIAVEAGIQAAVYRNTGLSTGERFRFGVTGVYYF